MVALKSNQIAGFLRSPGASTTAALLYGPDIGLVAERGRQLAETMARATDPRGEILRIADEELETNPDRLALDLRMTSMFGGRTIVRATPGRRLNAALLRPLLEEGELTGFLIVETDNLRPDEALRKLFEKAPRAVALPCYQDEARDLENVVREGLEAHGFRISLEARELLLARLGADRALSRGEVEKLALYAHGRDRIEAADVEAIVGDAADRGIDRLLAAVQAGDGARAVAECDRAISAGDNAQGLLLAALRHFQRLHRVRTALDAGRTLDEAVRGFRPPLHFRAKDAVAAGCRVWTSTMLIEAMQHLATATATARSGGTLEAALVEHALMTVAALAPRRRAVSAGR